MRASILAATFLSVCTTAALAVTPPAWRGHANSPQHTAKAPAATAGLGKILWQAPVDAQSLGVGEELAIHYAGPVITAANTVIVPYRWNPPNDWEIVAHAGATGATIWSYKSDYVSPASEWTPVVPIHITAQNKLVFAGAGGTVFERAEPDTAGLTPVRHAFYGNKVFAANVAAMTADVQINTPITADGKGNLYFGFLASPGNPANLVSGIARIAPNGEGFWVSAATAAGDAGITEVAMNCAPAVSADGKTIYIAVSNTAAGYLVGLDATTLATKYKVALNDPQSGQSAWIADLSTSSPTIGPDGDVYYGVLENPFPNHNDRGWLLHFNATLTTQKTTGSFGWDDTVSVVPASLIPSYTTTSSYLLMTKYNNYVGIGNGDGQNRIAILDPNVSQADKYGLYSTPATVMKEVQTQLGPSGSPEGGLYEWCINSSVVDTKNGAVYAGSEAGKMFRWDLATNTLSQTLTLNAPRPEPYTPSEVGPDGTLYSINNGTLYAIGK